MFGSKHEDPVLWFTFWCSQAFLNRTVSASAGLPSASRSPLSPQQRLTLANALREGWKQPKPIFSTKLRRLNPSQELFVELLLREFENALKTGKASFFRSMADALEIINQWKFADQARLLVFFRCFNIIDGRPVQKTDIPPTRSIAAYLKEHELNVDDRTIRRMKTELGIVSDAKRGRPVNAKLEKPSASGL